jgi:hypothetical protein
MQKKFANLPSWTFWTEEISAGVYNVKGKDCISGANLDLTGQDPEQLLQQARRAAVDLDRQVRGKCKRSK